MESFPPPGFSLQQRPGKSKNAEKNLRDGRSVVVYCWKPVCFLRLQKVFPILLEAKNHMFSEFLASLSLRWFHVFLKCAACFGAS